jgi:hypothetical protein
MMGAFNGKQVAQLLRPINETRVLRDGKGHSHVSQQDVTAHLIRVFGFGGFDTEILSCDLVFEEPRVDGKTGEMTGRWDVCYRATLALTVRDENGQVVCRFEDGSTGMAQNQTRGDGHDLAFKSALSLAKKRTAINLGDQYGLSLYNKGQVEALVRGTLVRPEDPEATTPGDVQEGVPQQVELGNDETPPPADDGLMSAAQKRAHNALVREVRGEAPSGRRDKRDGPEGERLAKVPENDPWYVDPEAKA